MTTAINLPVLVNQSAIPTGVYSAKTIKVALSGELNKQGQLHEPIKKILPILGMIGKLFQGFCNLAGIARLMGSQVFAPALRAPTRAIGQSIKFMIPHYYLGTAPLYHIANHVQGLAYARATIENIPKKNYTTFIVLIYAIDLVISHLFQESRQSHGTAMHIANQVVT
jgi:hypothetical protein